MVSTVIKHTAKEQLKGGIWQGFMAIFIFISIVLFVRLLEAVTRYSFSVRAAFNLQPENLILTIIWLAFTMVLIWPLWIGCTKYFLSIATTGQGNLRYLFDFFSTAKQIVFIIIANTIIILGILLTIILSLMPGILVLSVSQLYQNNITAVIITQFLGVLLLSFAIGFVIRIFLNMFLVPYLLAIGVTNNPFKIMKQSAVFMKGNRLRVLFLIGSFTGWMLLCALIIPMFYVFPYINTALAILAKDIITKNEQKEKFKADKYATIEF